MKGLSALRLSFLLFDILELLIGQFQVYFEYNVSNWRIQKQVLLMRPVLRRCLLAPYVPMPASGSANVPALNRQFDTLFEKQRIAQSAVKNI